MEACADRKNPPFCAISALEPGMVAAVKMYNPAHWKRMVDVCYTALNKAHFTRMYHLSTAYWMQVNGVWVHK